MALRAMASSADSFSTASTDAPQWRSNWAGFLEAKRQRGERRLERAELPLPPAVRERLELDRREQRRDAQVRGQSLISRTLAQGQAQLTADAERRSRASTDSTRDSTRRSSSVDHGHGLAEPAWKQMEPSGAIYYEQTRPQTDPTSQWSWYHQREERLNEARQLREEALRRAEAPARARVEALARGHAEEEEERQREIRERAAEARALVHGAEHRPERLPRAVLDGRAPGCEVDMSFPEKECAVCLEPLTDDVWQLPCPHGAHHFHKACILPWLRMHRNCILCRTQFDKKGEPVAKRPAAVQTSRSRRQSAPSASRWR